MAAADTYIRQIKEAPITDIKYIYDEELNTVFITDLSIEVFGKTFYGTARCSEEDIEFGSRMIGPTLAHMRAMRSALEYITEESRVQYQAFKHIYCGLAFGGSEDLVDPTRKFKKALNRLDNQYHQLVQAKKDLNKEINNYIQDISKAFDSLSKNKRKNS